MATETQIIQRQTIDTIIAKLLDMLGLTDNPNWTEEKKRIFTEEINKMFSEITTDERETLLWYIDIYNTYKWDFLVTYVFDFLKLSVSLARKGREEIKEIGKVPLQYENPNEKNRLQKLVDLFR